MNLKDEYMEHYESLNDIVKRINAQPFSIEGSNTKLETIELMIKILEKVRQLS